MSRLPPQKLLMPSILDRLVDPESGGPGSRQGYGLEQLLESVRRDLEDLLNTRRTPDEKWAGGQAQVLGYGIPEVSSLNAMTPEQRGDVGAMVAKAVSQYEPRLKEVRAVLVEQGESKDFTLRFRIEAKVAVEPAPDVVFDTILHLKTGQHSVQQSQL